MYLRTTKISRGNKIYHYLRLVEKVREHGKRKQKVLVTFGNLDTVGRDKVDSLLEALTRFSRRKIVDISEKLKPKQGLKFGPVLVARKIWDELLLTEKIKRLIPSKKISFAVSLATQVMAINRLIVPKSKLSVTEWQHEIYIEELRKKELSYQHFLRALDYIYRVKEPLEEEIFYDLRDLLNLKLNLVFYDLTSTYFEGQKCPLSEFGYSRDHRPDTRQIVLGLLVTDQGLPIAHEVFKGSRADKTTLQEAVEKLKKRFKIGRCIIVADRGVVSSKNIQYLENEQYEYIFALRKRRLREWEDLFYAKEPFVTVEENLKAKEVVKENTRYILCHNLEKEKDDKQFRNRLIERSLVKLEKLKNSRCKQPEAFIRKATKILTKLKSGKFFTYTVDPAGKFSHSLNESVLSKEETLDGKYILMTNIKNLSIPELIKSYKELSQVEFAFRTIKDFLRIRPVYHYNPRRVKAHVFICVLAYLLEKILAVKLKRAKLEISAERALEKLNRIQVIENELDGKLYRGITEISPQQRSILNACGISNLPKIF